MTPEEIKAAAENKIFEIMDKDPGLHRPLSSRDYRTKLNFIPKGINNNLKSFSI